VPLPGLRSQWFLWNPRWTSLLGSAPSPPTPVAGRIWVHSGPRPQRPPCTLIPTGYAAIWHQTRIRADLFDAVENFLDPMHTPFIHPGLVRSEGARSPTRVRIERGPDSIEAIYERPRHSGLIRSVFGLSIDQTRGRFRPPSLVELDYLAQGSLRLRILLGFTPISSTELGLSVGLFSPLPRVVASLVSLPLLPLLHLALRQDAAILALKLDHESACFSDRRYVHTPNDLLGPHILQWMKSARLGGRNREVTVLL